jgi:hypothetical protein
MSQKHLAYILIIAFIMGNRLFPAVEEGLLKNKQKTILNFSLYISTLTLLINLKHGICSVSVCSTENIEHSICSGENRKGKFRFV